MTNTRTGFGCRWLTFLTITLLFLTPDHGQAAADPELFGTYCGSHRESFEIVVPLFPLLPIPVKKTFHADFAITAHSNYYQTNRGNGVVSGSGQVTLTDHNFPSALAERYNLQRGEERSFAFSGYNHQPRKVKGAANLPGRGAIQGTLSLNSAGTEVEVRALDRAITISKLACGNRPPSARITTAQDTFSWGRTNHLAGAVSDDEPEPFPAERLVWTSASAPGWRQEGRLASLASLPPGRHQITFTATDAGGLQARAEKEITIENSGPDAVTIFSPTVDEVFCAGQPIFFDGWATDLESGNLTAVADRAFRWSYGADGFIGTGNGFTHPLPVGEHTITLTASDGLSAASATTTIRVIDGAGGSCGPSLSILSPLQHQVIGNETCILLKAELAFDPVDGELADEALTWRDEAPDMASREFSGREVEVCNFFAADGDTAHKIILTGTNSRGETRTVSRTIYVMPIADGPW